MRRRKFPQEVPAPIGQRHGGLSLQRCAAGHPLDLVLLDESEAPVLPCVLLPCLTQLFNERQVLSLILLEPILAKLSDLRSADFEDSAQHLVGRIGGVVLVSNDTPVLQL